MASRFPFEEDWRRRFGEFHELVPRYIAIGHHPAKGARAARTRAADQTPARPEQAGAGLDGGNAPRGA